MYCFTPNNELLFSLSHKQKYLPTYKFIFSFNILEDNSGSIWFYTEDEIVQVVRKKKYFHIYDPDPIQSNFVNSVSGNNNILWLGGTEEGIYSLDLNTGNFRLHFKDPLNLSLLPYSVNKIIIDNNGDPWFLMNSSGVYRIINNSSKEPEFKRVGMLQDVLSYGFPNVRTHLFEDKSKRIWIGYSDINYYYSPEQEQLYKLVDNPELDVRLPEGYNFISYEPDSESFLTSGASGIYRIYKPITVISEHEVIPNNIRKCNALNENGVISKIPSCHTSYLDEEGVLWIGTKDYGLVKLSKVDPFNDTLYRRSFYSSRQGFPDNLIESILDDRNGNLWIGTKAGLSKFNKATGTIMTFNRNNGLNSDNFRHESAYRADNGTMYFGTCDGLVSFHPDSIKNITYPVVFTELRINNALIKPGIGSVLKKSVTYSKQIELKYKQKNLSFSFASLNFVDNDMTQYKYKLDGLDSDWIFSGKRNHVSYTNLKPGKYIFRVTASNYSDVWSPEGALLAITIRPPPWQSWYAYLVYMLFLAGIIQWYRHFQRNRARLRLSIEMERVEKNKILELDQLKSRFFTNVSHEFRTPLTLIRGPLDDLNKQKKETLSIKRDLLGIMRRNTIRLQNLINQLLDISRIETGNISLQVNEGDLEAFVHAIILSFLSLAESRKIDYHFHLPDSGHVVWFDGDKVEKILVNIISNAFKFTPENGVIFIEFKYLSQEGSGIPVYVEFTVSDTGIGIPDDKLIHIFDRFYQADNSPVRNAEGTGIGLALTKELVDIYRGEIDVESTEGKGTTFRVKLPANKSMFREEEFTDHPHEVPELVIEDHIAPEDADADIIHEQLMEKNEKPLILVVEDNMDLTKYISGTLVKDYRILTAENGKSGFEQAIGSIPDLVITDLMMPVMDGMELCRLIKVDDRTGHIPVIMLTARADRDSRLKGLKTGADDYIIKPFDAEELRVRISNLIEQRKKLREKFRKEFFTLEMKAIPIRENDQLIDKLLSLIEEYYSDFGFSVDEMCEKLNMGRTVFFKKVHALTDESPNEILRMYRMKKAAEMLRSGNKNITTVMYEVGFQSTSHFANSFKKYYGLNPSEYRDGLR